MVLSPRPFLSLGRLATAAASAHPQQQRLPPFPFWHSALTPLQRGLEPSSRTFSTTTAAQPTPSPASAAAGPGPAAAAAADVDPMAQVLRQALEGMRSAGTLKSERVITSPQGPAIWLQAQLDPHRAPKLAVLNFCSNNYLGLSDHPDIRQAAAQALLEYGFGLSSVRFICGTQVVHKQLEERVSRFHRTQDTILYPSCFDANAGLFEALLGPEDAVLSDELNHASIIDGVRLCKAQQYRYKHMDMSDLEAKLQEATAKGARIKLIATDGVFSMDGHIAPLSSIVQLAKKYGAYTFVDDCHATGFIGLNGRGTPEHWGVEGRVDIINSTLGKALGGATGGYTTGRTDVIQVLRQRSRPYLFSNTLAPAVAGASLAVFDLIERSPQLREQLNRNTQWFRSAMTAAGFDIGQGTHPIVPIMLGDASLATTMAAELLEMGIYVVGFSYPVVPKGQARIRVQISAAHEEEHLQSAVAAFTKVGQRLGVCKA